MRRSYVVLGSVFAVSSALVLAGCLSSDDASSPPPADGGAAFDGYVAPFDASTGGDASTHDSSATDAPASDDSPSTTDASDATAPEVALAASATNVSAEGDVTLTVTLNGITATSVEIDEGTTPIATLTAGPYTQPVTFTFLENGTHTYTAKATLADSSTVTSAPVTITVNVPANGFFVDPVNGLDSPNTGTQASPFKTIAKAATSLTTDGQSIYLAPGTYDSATQTVMNFTFPHVTDVRALGPGVILTGIPSAGNVNMFLFSKGGEARNLAFKSIYQGIQSQAGTLHATGCSFDTVSTPYYVTGTTVATIDETGIATPFTNPQGAGLATVIVTDSAANVTFNGGKGSFTGVAAQYVSTLFVRGHSTLVMNDFTIKNVAQHAVTLYDNGHLTLSDVTIDKSGFATSSGPDRANIAMGGQNTEAPMTTSLVITGGGITSSTGPGIVLTLYPNTGATPSITLTDTHVDNGVAQGLWVSSSNSGTTIATITATNTTFDGNGAAGLFLGAAHLTMTGGSSSTNKGDGIQFSDPTSVNTVKLRNATFHSTGGDAIDMNGTSASTLDLGTAASAGGNVFTGIPAGTAAVHVETAIAGQAVGNTWMPNEQSADATGKYTTPTTLTSASPVGLNAKLVSGATLVVE